MKPEQLRALLELCPNRRSIDYPALQDAAVNSLPALLDVAELVGVFLQNHKKLELAKATRSLVDHTGKASLTDVMEALNSRDHAQRHLEQALARLGKEHE